MRVLAGLMLAVVLVALPRLEAEDHDPRRPAELTPAGVAKASVPKQSDGWGPDHDGLRCRLLPAQQDYVVGGRAIFRLEMKNFGEHVRMYDSQQVDVNDSMRVSNGDGKPIRYVGGSFQTVGNSESIAPGDTVVLKDSIDLTDQYLFVTPGSYTVQFRGQHNLDTVGRAETPIPPSHTITIEVRPGTMPVDMKVPARLIEILPDKWCVSLNGRVSEERDGRIAPPGWESGSGTYVSLERDAKYKNDVLRVHVWVAKRKLAWTGKGQTGEAVKPGETAIYLGEGADGHVFWILPETAEKEWLEIHAKVRGALQIRPLVPKSGVSGRNA